MTVRAREIGLPAMLVATYALLAPFLFGLPRGIGLPVLRPSEALQMAVTGAAIMIAAVAAFRGRRWRVRLLSFEWWLLATIVTASVVPVLWLMARGRAVGPDELLAVFPFVKYGAWYVLARSAVRTADEVRLVVAAVVAAATAIAGIAVTQALGVGPVVEVIGRFFVSSSEDIVDGGRATTTIGSSIATGAYLALSTGLVLAIALSTGRRAWFLVLAPLAAGALASGQAGTVIGLTTVVATVAHLHGRFRQIAMASTGIGVVAMIPLWPILAARLADIDQGSGLPMSWVIRWNNLSQLYLPRLRSGGWVLGVTPDATTVPPDVWRDVVFLESGYLWLLWVGGVPLLAAASGFLITAWRTPISDPADPGSAADGLTIGVARAARAGAVAMAAISVIDPHLTLRAGADLFFLLLALGVAGRPMTMTDPFSAAQWRRLLLTDGLPAGLDPAARIQLREADLRTIGGPLGSMGTPEAAIDLTVVVEGRPVSGTVLTLHRTGRDLHGVVVPRTPLGFSADSGSDFDRGSGSETTASNDGVDALVRRAIVACADRMRVASLRWPAQGASIDRSELKRVADLVDTLEVDRLQTCPGAPDGYADLRRPSNNDRQVDRPGIRLDPVPSLPRWKRAADLALVTVMTPLVVPIAAVCAAAVRMSRPGPIVFRQVRVGAGGLPFQLYKFRTMKVDNDDRVHREQNQRELLEGADAMKDGADPRITPVGRWLRRLSLDELPQLLNVARGEMSLVGPRPSLLWETELFEPSRRRRLTVRPGLTGLWQVGGRADVSMTEMLDIDLDYVDSFGPMTDARCLVGTASSVMAGRGAR